MADDVTLDATKSLLALFEADADGNMTFKTATDVTAVAFYQGGHVGLRIDMARDQEHLRAILADTEKPDGLNLSLKVETAMQMRDQLDRAIMRLAAKEAKN
jgi:hypothetical protein